MVQVKVVDGAEVGDVVLRVGRVDDQAGVNRQELLLPGGQNNVVEGDQVLSNEGRHRVAAGKDTLHLSWEFGGDLHHHVVGKHVHH